MPETLTAEMEAEHRKWARGTRVYGTVYPSVRLLLIVASAVVSSKDSLSASPGGALVPFSLIALLVSVVTAIDTWMKPRDKWRGFMRDRDDLADLILRIRGVRLEESGALDEVRRTFAELRRRHHETNVY